MYGSLTNGIRIQLYNGMTCIVYLTCSIDTICTFFSQVVTRIITPGFMSRRHCLTRIKEHPLQKLDIVYAQPAVSEDVTDLRNSTLWLWSRQDTERNYSTMDVRRGVCV